MNSVDVKIDSLDAMRTHDFRVFLNFEGEKKITMTTHCTINCTSSNYLVSNAR